jgi:hypothetical protein
VLELQLPRQEGDQMSERRKLEIEWKCPECSEGVCQHMLDAMNGHAREAERLTAEVARLTRERDRYRTESIEEWQRRAVESKEATMQRALAAEAEVAVWGRRNNALAEENAALRVRALAAESALSEAREVVREAEAAMTWATDRSAEACQTMVRESAPWRVKARSWLARLDAQGKGR